MQRGGKKLNQSEQKLIPLPGRDVRQFPSSMTSGGHRQELLLKADPLCMYAILRTKAENVLLLLACNVYLYVRVIYIVVMKIPVQAHCESVRVI